MGAPMPRGLKTFFLLHALVGTPFGVLYMLPNIHGPLIGMRITEPVMHRLFGIAIVALSIGSFFASRRTAWDEVRIVVRIELVFTPLVAGTVFHALMTGAFPPAIWLDLSIVIALIIGYGYFYLKAPRSSE